MTKQLKIGNVLLENIYIDFDGVIMDTNRVTYDMLDRLEVDKTDNFLNNHQLKLNL